MIINSFEIDRINEIVYFAKNFSNDIKIIIIGERHCNDIDFSIQKELIKSLKPNVILVEMLKTLEYDPNTDSVKLREGIRYDQHYENELDNLNVDYFKDAHKKHYELAKELKIPLVGCDISSYQLYEEMKKYYSFIKNLGETEISKKFLREFEDIYKKFLRENEMGRCIDSSKNFKIIVVILGNDHAMKTSYIYNFVKFAYASIYMGDICHVCKKKIKEYDKKLDQCQSCHSIRKRYIEIEKLDVI